MTPSSLEAPVSLGLSLCASVAIGQFRHRPRTPRADPGDAVSKCAEVGRAAPAFPSTAASTKAAAMDLTHLGRSNPLPASPAEATLDYVPNPRPGSLYLVRFAAPEFTSLCPVT